MSLQDYVDQQLQLASRCVTKAVLAAIAGRLDGNKSSDFEVSIQVLLFVLRSSTTFRRETGSDFGKFVRLIHCFQ